MNILNQYHFILLKYVKSNFHPFFLLRFGETKTIFMKRLKQLSIVIVLMTISFIIGLKLQSKPSVTELRTLQADSFEGEPVCESVDSLNLNY